MSDTKFERLQFGGFFSPVQCFARLRQRQDGVALVLAEAIGSPPLSDAIVEIVEAALGGGVPDCGLVVATAPPDGEDDGGWALVHLGQTWPTWEFCGKDEVANRLGVEMDFLAVEPAHLIYLPPPHPTWQDTEIQRFPFRTAVGSGECRLRMRRALEKTLVLVEALPGHLAPSDAIEAIIVAALGKPLDIDHVAVVERHPGGDGRPDRYALVSLWKGGPVWNYTSAAQIARVLGTDEGYISDMPLSV